MTVIAKSTIKRAKKLSTEHKWAIVSHVLRLRTSGSQKKGEMSKLAKEHGVSRTTVHRVMNEHDTKILDGEIIPDLSRKVGEHLQPQPVPTNVAHNIKIILEECGGKITYRKLQKVYEDKFSVKLSVGVLHKYMKRMGVTKGTCHVKPMLTLKHKADRLQWVLSLTRKHKGVVTFEKMLNFVHIDEKWFNGQPVSKRIMKLPNMSRYRSDSVIHKSHIPKIMFLSAIGVPQTVKLPDGSTHFFDGKIGIWPFAKFEPCKRNSKNRRKGTLVLTPFNVDAKAYKTMLLEHVFPAIIKKMFWISQSGGEIVVQQDGARPHTEMEYFERSSEDVCDGAFRGITVRTQPAQSPDLNKNDLCFFASLQKHAEDHKSGGGVESIYNSVQKAYFDYDTKKLTRIHAHLLEVMRKIMENGGDNQYNIPHSNITKRQNSDDDTTADYEVPMDLYMLAKTSLNELRDRML